MTPESIRYGRRTTSSQQLVIVGTSSVTFLVSSPRRVAIIVSAPPTNRFTLSLQTTAVLDQGINVYPTGQPLVLTIETHGDLVTRAWTAISATASQSVTVIEVFAEA